MLSSEISSKGKLALALKDVTIGKINGPTFKHINWEVREGEAWAITGPIGAGKTTFAEALAGQYRAQNGSMQYYFLPDQKNILDAKKYIAFISFQPNNRTLNYSKYYYQQRYNSTESEGIITVQEFLLETTASALHNADWKKVIQLIHIEELLDLEVIKSSNGQTRKMLIAQALLRKPHLLILDNPFSGLDKQTRQDFKRIIQNLIQHGTRIILVTNQNDIPESISHVLLLDNFAVQGSYTRAEYLQHHSPNMEASSLNQQPESHYLFNSASPEPDFEVAVKFENTTVRYDNRKVLDQINWTVKRGEKWALLGPNGSGKTTLLSLINADNPQAFANKITLFDRRKGSGESIWDIKKQIGFVSPELHLYFRQNLTAETVAATGFFDTLYPKRSLTAAETDLISAFFSFYNMEPLRNKRFLQLSSGEQRLVLIVRSLLKNPELLIWDEPFQGLSSSYIKESLALLKAYAVPSKTVIFVSHYDQEIPDWIDKRLILEKGRVKEIIE